MYYYIFQSPKSSAEKTFYEKIRDLARQYSIHGEITQASPARSAEELAKIAIAKEISTIIAIGDDTHINTVASAILKQRPNFPMALGIICTDTESMLYERWGFKRPEDAVATISQRKLESFDVGLIEPDQFFLTSAKIEPSKPTRVTIEVDKWRADAIIDRLEVSGNLYILLERFYKEESVLKSAINLFTGKSSFVADRSLFKARMVTISSEKSLPISVGNRTVATTPVNIYRKTNALNIITKRDSIPRESKRVTVTTGEA